MSILLAGYYLPCPSISLEKGWTPSQAAVCSIIEPCPLGQDSLLMKMPGPDNTNAGLDQGCCGVVDRIVFIQVVVQQGIHQAFGNNLFFGHKVVQNITGVLTAAVDIRITAFVFGGDVGDFPGYFNQLLA